MAALPIALIRGHVNQPSETIDLSDVVLDNFVFNTAPDSEATVKETIPIIFSPTSNDIEEEIFKIEAYFNEVREYENDNTYPFPVFVRRFINGTAYLSLIKEAYLVHIYLEGGTKEYSEQDGTAGRFNLEIIRDNSWELETFASETQVGPKPEFGGFYNYTNEKGTKPSRIHTLSIDPAAGGYYNFWFGFRKIRQGNTNFNPLIEIEDGSISDGDSSFIADTNCNGDEKLQVTFSNENLIERASVRLANVVAQEIHVLDLTGNYLILGRARVTSGTVGLQLRHGMENPWSSNYTIERELVIANTTFKTVPMGLVQIPPIIPVGLAGYYGAEHYMQSEVLDFSLRIWAERLTGSGNLEFDGFCLMPQDASVSVVSYAPLASLDIETRYSGELGIQGGTFTDDTIVNVDTAVNNWLLPPGNGTWVVATEASANQPYNNINIRLKFPGRFGLAAGVYSPDITL